MSEAAQMIAWAHDDVMARQLFRYSEEREFVALMDAKIAAQLYNDPPEPTHFSGLARSVRRGHHE